MNKQAFFLALCVLFALSLQVVSQQAQAGAACTIKQPPLLTHRANIFSDEAQEWLGDAEADELEPYYDLLPAKDSAELDRIATKLLTQLPPTPIHFKFRVYASDEVNAFSLAGGYVYVSRKLITDVQSEDELAGVLAHEIGHIYTRQLAADYTREFKSRVGVASVDSRDDVEDKLQLLLNSPWKDSAGESEKDAEDDELLADHVGMYALIRAGYAPRAFSENLNRISANKGRTGNFLTDVFGTTSEISLRVRVARKIADSISVDCASRRPSSLPQFQAFQQGIRDVLFDPIEVPTPNLDSFLLLPPMPPEIHYVHFSPDGRYILAQNSSEIQVLNRSPLKLLFTIDAREALEARFTPNSSHIVFSYPTMRVEDWDIASQKRASYHELVDYNGCTQTSLSPDGKIFVCMSQTEKGIWLRVTDVDTGNRISEDKSFYKFDFLAATSIIVRNTGTDRIGTVAYSQDGHYMIIVAGAKHLAYDLLKRAPIELGGSLESLSDGRIAFADPSHLVYQCDSGIKGNSASDKFQMCEATFPEGAPIQSFQIGYQWLESLTRSKDVLIGPSSTGAAMLADPSTGKAVLGLKFDSLDVYSDTLAIENDTGGVTLGSLDGKNSQSLELPTGPLTNMAAASFSHDGRFLAYSTRFRSSIWDLKARKRVALMRPFRVVRFDGGDQMYAQYTQLGQHPGVNYHIDLTTGKAVQDAPYAIDQFQRSDVLVTFDAQEKTGDISKDTNLEVADRVTGKLLWSKHFSDYTPIVRQSEGNELLLHTPLQTDTAEHEIKHLGRKLLSSSDWKGNFDSPGLLVEVVDGHTGEILHAMQVPMRWDSSNGSDTRTESVYEDYLLVRGIYNNTVIYRLSDGKRLGAFFGRTVTCDPSMGLVAATNRDQDVIIYDANTGKALFRVRLDQLVQAARFDSANKTLLVLTASQRVYSIPLPIAPVAAGTIPKS